MLLLRLPGSSTYGEEATIYKIDITQLELHMKHASEPRLTLGNSSVLASWQADGKSQYVLVTVATLVAGQT